YFVAPGDAGASDGNDGSAATPWATPAKARSVMVAGDITYLKGGTYSATDPDSGGTPSTFFLSDTNAAGAGVSTPIAYIGYPGSPPTFSGSTAHSIYVSTDIGPYIFAGLAFSGVKEGIGAVGNGQRVIGNRFDVRGAAIDMSTPGDNDRVL